MFYCCIVSLCLCTLICRYSTNLSFSRILPVEDKAKWRRTSTQEAEFIKIILCPCGANIQNKRTHLVQQLQKMKLQKEPYFAKGLYWHYCHEQKMQKGCDLMVMVQPEKKS